MTRYARGRKICHETEGLLSNLGITSIFAFRLLLSASIPNSEIRAFIYMSVSSFQDLSTLVKYHKKTYGIFSIVKAIHSRADILAAFSSYRINTYVQH